MNDTSTSTQARNFALGTGNQPPQMSLIPRAASKALTNVEVQLPDELERNLGLGIMDGGPLLCAINPNSFDADTNPITQLPTNSGSGVAVSVLGGSVLMAFSNPFPQVPSSGLSHRKPGRDSLLQTISASPHISSPPHHVDRSPELGEFITKVEQQLHLIQVSTGPLTKVDLGRLAHKSITGLAAFDGEEYKIHVRRRPENFLSHSPQNSAGDTLKTSAAMLSKLPRASFSTGSSVPNLCDVRGVSSEGRPFSG